MSGDKLSIYTVAQDDGEDKQAVRVKIPETVDVEGTVEIDSSTPVNIDGIVEIAENQEIIAIENQNVETSKVAVETWYQVPQNAKGVIVQLDATGAGVSANVEYTLDRAGVVAGSTTSFEKWANGAVTNGVKSAEFPAIAGVRMTDVVTNEVVAVPTVTKITFATAVPTTGDTIVFGDETYEFTTDSETKLTDPANIRIDMDALSITDETTASQGFKTVFNANTAYDVVGTGDAAVITLTASDNFELYNDLVTTTSITATATATYEDTTFGGGTGDSTTGVDSVAATLPKLLITVV